MRQPFDAAARAKVIAPFLEEQTVAILHVDFTRLDVGATLDEVGQFVPETQPQMAVGKAAGTAMLAAFNQAGGKDVYICVTLAGSLSEKDLLYVVLPLSPGANQDVLAGMIRQCNPQAFAASERVGDVLLVGTPGDGRPAQGPSARRGAEGSRPTSKRRSRRPATRRRNCSSCRRSTAAG